MTYIQEVHAPDLSGLFRPVAANYILNIVFRGPGPEDKVLRSYLSNFIRATDRALEEYEQGRLLLTEYVGSANRTLLLLRALSHFETCIHSAKRAHRFFGRMRAHPEGPAVDRLAGRVLMHYERQITPLRDTIEHVDERIERGEIADGEPVALAISQDGRRLEIASLSLSLQDLASMLTRLHEVALQLADPKSAFP